MGPFSRRLTLADLFLDFLLLKVSLRIFQRKLPNMKSNYSYPMSTIIRYISSETTPRLKLHMTCYEVFLLRWIPRSIYKSGHLSCFNAYTANFYYETTTKLQQKFFSLDFTTTDRSILQIVVLLKENLLQFKVPISSSSMFAGNPVSITCPVFDKS